MLRDVGDVRSTEKDPFLYRKKTGSRYNRRLSTATTRTNQNLTIQDSTMTNSNVVMQSPNTEIQNPALINQVKTYPLWVERPRVYREPGPELKKTGVGKPLRQPDCSREGDGSGPRGRWPIARPRGETAQSRTAVSLPRGRCFCR